MSGVEGTATTPTSPLSAGSLAMKRPFSPSLLDGQGAHPRALDFGEADGVDGTGFDDEASGALACACAHTLLVVFVFAVRSARRLACPVAVLRARAHACALAADSGLRPISATRKRKRGHSFQLAVAGSSHPQHAVLVSKGGTRLLYKRDEHAGPRTFERTNRARAFLFPRSRRPLAPT